MVRIRLRRVGAKKQPGYRLVVTDSLMPRDGRFIETVGFYNPRTEPPTVRVNEERVLYWLGQGAQPTNAVAKLLTPRGTLERFAHLKKGEPLETLLAEAGEAPEEVAGETEAVPVAEAGEAPEEAAGEIEVVPVAEAGEAPEEAAGEIEAVPVAEAEADETTAVSEEEAETY
jgi:small subunit ribosomal protein S16